MSLCKLLRDFLSKRKNCANIIKAVYPARTCNLAALTSCSIDSFEIQLFHVSLLKHLKLVSDRRVLMLFSRLCPSV